MAEALDFGCDLCGRSFASFRGMRAHQQKAHRPEYDQRLLEQRGEIKARWTAEEIFLLAKELELERQNVTFMNMALDPFFPARTLEAIKGKRKQPSYRRVPEDLRARQVRAVPNRPDEIAPERNPGVDEFHEYRYRLRPRPAQPAAQPGEARPEIYDLRMNVPRQVDEQPVERIPWELPEQGENDYELLLNKMTDLGMVIGEPRRPPQDRPLEQEMEVRRASRAQRKRRQYAKTQSMYAKGKAETLKYIVDRNNYVERAFPSFKIRSQWQEYFSVNPGLRRVDDGQQLAEEQDPELLRSLDAPITLVELEAALKNTSPSTARGLDGISLADLRAIDREELLNVLNGIFRMAPERIYRGRITLLPKKNRPTEFGDFRPICVMPLVIRTLHRILAARLSVIKHVRFQAGFCANRGTSENIWLLKELIRSAGPRKTSTYLALLDFKKAFDSVSHQALMGLLYVVGIAPGLVGYIQSVYGWTKLTMGDEWFVQRRGVLQGDPLSPILFNIAIDYVGGPQQFNRCGIWWREDWGTRICGRCCFTSIVARGPQRLA
ncbi:UNVERIFIED_CONTAM: hypothetical protein RMT77_002535 [Armadillidium vulgare]